MDGLFLVIFFVSWNCWSAIRYILDGDMSLMTSSQGLGLDVWHIGECLMNDSSFIGCHWIEDDGLMGALDISGISSGNRDKLGIFCLFVSVTVEKDTVMSAETVEAGRTCELIDGTEGVTVSTDDILVSCSDDVKLDDSIFIFGFGGALDA